MTAISSSISSALGIGSGIDTSSLVSSLVAAVRDPKQASITSRQSLNATRISALASATSSLNTFADALNSLLSSTGYSGTPASNDSSIAAVSAIPGGVPAGLPAQLRVQQLASAQTLASASVSGATKDTVVGTGTLSLKVGDKAAVDITITSSNNTYAGIAAAINASGQGVTASVVTDTNGTRLVMKGATGEAQAFSMTVNDPASPLAQFTWNDPAATTTMNQTSVAQNALISIDGVEQEYASNTIDNAIPFLRIDLNKAAPGVDVTLATTEPTTSMRDLMVEFVDAYNTLMKGLNTTTATGTDQSNSGVLIGDSAIRDMKRQLSAMTSTSMAASGPFKNLVDLGISTNRDGTLKLDTAVLDKAIAADPQAVTQLLNPAVKSATQPGLAGLMDSVRDKIEQTDGPLATSKKKYDDLAAKFTKELEALDDKMADYEARLTSTYTKMESRLTALKATQSYLEQQIAVWNNSNN